jgi:hypothetical protein
MQAFGPFLSVRVEIYAVHVWNLYVVYKCLCVYSYFLLPLRIVLSLFAIRVLLGKTRDESF